MRLVQQAALTCPCPAVLQRGQSTVEFLVLGFAFVPLLLLTPLLAKYIDLMQASEQASRYVAFQAVTNNNTTAWRSDADLSQEVRRRFFNTSEAPIKTNDAAGDFAAHRNPLWVDHRGAPLLAQFVEDVAATGRAANTDPLSIVELVTDRLDLERENLYTGSVTVRPRNIVDFAPFDAIDLQITRRTVLLADPWTARSTGDISNRIRNLDRGLSVPPMYPQYAQFTEEVLQLFREIPPLITDPRPSFGPTTWEAVPCDRLQEGC